MPPKNNNNFKSKKAQARAMTQLASAVKQMRIKPKTQKKMSVGSLAGFLPANVTYKGTTDIGVALGKKMAVVGPSMSGRGRVYNVKNRELVLSEIAGATSFTQQGFIEINPGLAATFPWLAAIAQNYSEYKFNKLVFRYVTRSPTTLAGSVMLLPLYDPLAVAPVSEQAASSVRGTLEGPVWEELAISVDQLVANAYKRYFIRNGPVAADQKTYDPCALVVYTNDCVGTTPVGKLWVEYDVDFFEPTSSLDAGVPTQAPHGVSMWAWVYGASNQNMNSGVNNVDWRIGAPVCNALSLTLAGGAPVVGGYFIPPPGCYIIRAYFGLSDDTAEILALRCQILKNGSIITTGTAVRSTMTVNSKARMDIMACVNCSGTDEIKTVIWYDTGAGAVVLETAAISLEICSN